MKTELLILGGGPGGYVAAIRAGRMGMKTILVEKHKIGGVCLNYGCVPTKVLLGKTAILKEIGKGKRFGLSAENVSIDFKKLSVFKTQTVTGLVKGIESILKSANVEIINEEGIFVDGNKLELSSGQIIEFDKAIIATGSCNRELSGLETDGKLVIDSTGALELTEVPESMLVIGAGAIGLELGTVFQRLGCNVTVVEMMTEIVPGMDTELAGILRNALSKEGMRFKLGLTVESLKRLEDKVEVKIKGDDEVKQYSRVLVAVGRTPNTEAFKKLELRSDRGGFVQIDDEMNTNITKIKAIGDITGPPLLAHRASHQGIIAVESFAGVKAGHFPPVPGAVFTEPEFASVGMTKAQAQNAGINANEYMFPLQAVSRARTMAVSEGGFKIVTNTSGKILGVHILAPGAGDMIAEASLAMSVGMSVKQLAEAIHVHPTLSEGVMEAALMADGRAVHL